MLYDQKNTTIDSIENIVLKLNRSGYIFIGDYDNNIWTKKMFNENIENPVLINKNDILTLSNNMYLRSDIPKNTDDYYKNIKAITILNKGTKVTIIDKAIGIKRKHATQWWIHVSY